MQQDNTSYDYEYFGFNQFLQRSIDGKEGMQAVAQSRNINFDQAAVSGSLGDMFRIGRILLDGKSGRISVFDTTDNEVVRIGEI